MEDHEGYEVQEQGGTDTLGRPSQSIWRITRLADGRSLGSYGSPEDVDRVIAHDRRIHPLDQEEP